MKLLSDFTFKKLINNKKFLIAVSLIISIFIWFSAAILRNPVREKTFSDIAANITLKDTVAAEKYGLQIVSDVSQFKFSVTVKGSTHVISGVTKEDFTLKADVSNINEPNDNCTLKIVPEKLTDEDYQFVAVEPATVTVKIDRISTKDFELTAQTPVEIKTDTENGYLAAEPALNDTTESKIRIEGSVNALAEVKSVVAMADYDGSLLSKAKTYDAYIVLYNADNSIIYQYMLDGTVKDGDGNTVDTPELMPEFTATKVTLTVLKKAVLPVSPTFENLPSDLTGSDISYNVSPSEITVTGPPDVIAKLKQINLKAIDYRSISADGSNRIFKVKADLEKIKLSEDDETVFTVTVTGIKDNKFYK